MKFLSLVKSRFDIFVAFLFFALTFIVYYFSGEGRATPYHYFVLLADAFLHGRLYVLEKPPWLSEFIPIAGKFYVAYPPMPAILLLPQVAISGLKANQTLASVFWGSLNVSLVYLLMRRLTNNRRLQLWMTVFFGFGTIHWYLASIGSAWYFAHVTSFLFLTLAIYETFTNQRPFLVGLFLGASYWSRLPTILSLPFFLIMLSDKWLKRLNDSSFLGRINLIPLLKLGSGVGIFVILNFVYNFVRFGTPLDVSYYLIPGIFEEPWYQKGIFDTTYIPRHLKIIFAGFPIFLSKFPYVKPSLSGMSIWLTTPAFIYALFAGIRNRLAIGCWLSIIPIALVEFTHGTTGFTQFGYRFAVDFYPFLFLLTVKGIGNNIRWHHKILISIGVLVNLWGVLWINKLGWVGYWK